MLPKGSVNLSHMVYWAIIGMVITAVIIAGVLVWVAVHVGIKYIS